MHRLCHWGVQLSSYWSCNLANISMHINCPSVLPIVPRGASGTILFCIQQRVAAPPERAAVLTGTGCQGDMVSPSILFSPRRVCLTCPFTQGAPSCTPGGALARPASGSGWSRNAHAGTRPRSAACADCARAGQTSLCTCGIHTITAAWSLCCLHMWESALHATGRTMYLLSSGLQEQTWQARCWPKLARCCDSTTGGAPGVAAEACLPCQQESARLQLLRSYLVRWRMQRCMEVLCCRIPVKQPTSICFGSTMIVAWPCASWGMAVVSVLHAHAQACR